ncbi:calcium-binding protein [Methylopila sp. M107]|uniref:calcium-binding protein n=1 Tax=Methylopila sp. M107 TaxID=1101190 RepID=UPI000382DF9D|nr:calcium-binding protein [Methylopila sp. M107]
MRITDYQQRVTPEFTIVRGETGVGLSFFYGLEGYYDPELDYYLWAGDISATLGDFGGYHYEDNDRPMEMSFSATLEDGVTYEGQYELNDFNDGTYLLSEFTVTAFDSAADFTGGERDDFVFGSDEADRLSGGLGNDVFEGGGGRDSLAGGDGADRLSGGGKRDLLNGDVGDDALHGGGGRDRLNGGDGDDRLSGGRGADRLTGGEGADTFVFETALVEGKADVIRDFETGVDSILLDRGVFSAIAGETFDDAAFVANSTGVAETEDQRIVFNTRTGELLYDPDGSGDEEAIVFAVLKKGATIDAGDFLLA